ncbi:MAG: hypothetical protein ACQETI_10525 [Halobacteriota archaeon]
MTGFLGRLRNWLGGLLGSRSEEETPTEAQKAGRTVRESTARTQEPSHRCTVCGTPVDDPTGGCPLCKGTEFEAVGDEGGSKASATESTQLRPDKVRTSRTTDDAAAVDRLKELRKQQKQGAQESGDGEHEQGQGQHVDGTQNRPQADDT